MMDADQSGQSQGQKVRVYNGPSLGWVETQVKPARTITVAGTFAVLPGDSIILVNVAGSVTLTLPDVIAWCRSPGYEPASGFERAIWVKDLGGNAGAFPITITPFGSQSIDLFGSFQIVQNRQLLRLYPRQIELTGWFSG
jgi:hypothetical protein